MLSTSVIREVQNKTTMAYYYAHLRTDKMRKTDQMLTGCGANETLIPCWCEDKVVQPILANSRQHHKYTPTTQPSHSPPRYLSWRNGNICPYKELFMNVHSSFIYKHQKLETIQTAINRWMDKPIVVLSLQEIATQEYKEWTDTHNINKSQND